MKNPAKLSNFLSTAARRFAIVDETEELYSTAKVHHEIASGKTPAQARERFYSRWINRPGIDHEVVLTAQRFGRLKLIEVVPGGYRTIESGLVLVA